MKHWMNVGYHSTLPPWHTMATNDDIMTTTTTSTYQGYPWKSCRLRSCIAHPFGPWEMIGARRLPCWWLICSFIKGKAVKEVSRSASRNGTVSCTIESPQISSKKQWFSSSTRLLAAFAIVWNCWSCSEDSRMKRWIDCVPFSPTILLWRSILWRWPTQAFVTLREFEWNIIIVVTVATIITDHHQNTSKYDIWTTCHCCPLRQKPMDKRKRHKYCHEVIYQFYQLTMMCW